MKNTLSRVFALLVALLVLAMPIGALAENEIGATLALSNLSLSIGEELNVNVDATVRLDLAADMEAGNFAGTLTALAASDKALKGGFTFDMSTMSLTAGLEGVTDAVLIPMAEAIEAMQAQMGGMFSEEQMAAIMNVVNAYVEMVNLFTEKGDVLAAAVQEKISAKVNSVMTDGHKGPTTVNVAGNELPADQYDYELTMAEMMGIAADVMNAIKGDPELTAALQNYIDALTALSGEESIDIASLDIDALLAEADADANVYGSLYLIDENSFVFDMNMAVTENEQTVVVPLRFITLAGETEAYIAFNMDMNDAGTPVSLSLEAHIPTDGTPTFGVALTGIQGTEEAGQNVLVTLDGDFSEGANVTLYLETTSSYSYEGETYKSLNAFGVNYAGTTVSDENGIAFPGRLTLFMNDNGSEMSLGMDTLISVGPSAVEFEMPHNVINITEADEDTMNALAEEYMGALSNGLMILMGAPGVQDLMNMLTPAA